MLLVHDRVGEDKFVADGYGIDRRDVMHNDFVIVRTRTPIPQVFAVSKMPAEHLRQSPLRELYLRAEAMTAAPTGWSFDYGSWQASSHGAKLGTPIWLKASVPLLILLPRSMLTPSQIEPLGPASGTGRTSKF